jgi:hypothetical protein
MAVKVVSIFIERSQKMKKITPSASQNTIKAKIFSQKIAIMPIRTMLETAATLDKINIQKRETNLKNTIV